MLAKRPHNTPSRVSLNLMSLNSHVQIGFFLLTISKIEDSSTSTPIIEQSSNVNNDDQGSQIEPVPPALAPPVYETSSKPSSSPWFTFDDILHRKWPARY